ncbi:zinc finger protein 629 isoform X4 [Salarias fasciatus]|uniref:zinc finger protein 629 isoform X4 n=1 Tax=Salarias fasciatus TaxID=181472 RepID=UPI001176DF9C|nr:zinc finger protein 629-like isoform X4 [Salarias fasciatus]
MDESTPAEISEDTMGNKPNEGQTSCGKDADPSTGDTPNKTDGSIECEDCGLTFELEEDYRTHLHQHALEDEDGPAEDCEDAAAGQVSWTVDGDGGQDVSSSGLAQVEGAGGSSAAAAKPRQLITCSVCGKSYTYQSSFRRHQRLHEIPDPDLQRRQRVDANLPTYECPDCGMSFIRKTRLLSHLRVHRSRREVLSAIPGCEQCDRSFHSVESWMAHMNSHQEKPFWCLSCAVGFLSEETLDKHLQNHSQKHSRRRKGPSQLKRLPQGRPFKCPICGKTFCHAGNLFSHKRKKHRWLLYRRDMLKGDSASAEVLGGIGIDASLPHIKEEEGTTSDMEEAPRSEENMHGNESEHPQQFEDGADPEDSDSDCGEPLHCFRAPNPSESQANQNVGDVHREHKYFEWECFDCDMGFDDMAGLRLHYIKHATGEIPMLQDDDIEA